jgi:hypothetical protein
MKQDSKKKKIKTSKIIEHTVFYILQNLTGCKIWHDGKFFYACKILHGAKSDMVQNLT